MTSFTAVVPKGGSKFDHFLGGPFDLKYALSSPGPGLVESGVRSKRGKREVLELKNLKNREISFLTRILGRMTPICIFIYKTPNIVHKGPI